MNIVRDMIKHQRNAVVAQQSAVVETKKDGRIIKNGEDTFTVKDENIMIGKRQCRRFSMEDQNGNFECLNIEYEKREFLSEAGMVHEQYGYVYFGDRPAILGSKKFTGEDLNNINDIRYHLKHNEEALHFFG